MRRLRSQQYDAPEKLAQLIDRKLLPAMDCGAFCDDIAAFRRALDGMTTLRAPESWLPIEGRSAAEIHQRALERTGSADALAALRRGLIPAIVWRGAIPRVGSLLERMETTLSGYTRCVQCDARAPSSGAWNTKCLAQCGGHPGVEEQDRKCDACDGRANATSCDSPALASLQPKCPAPRRRKDYAGYGATLNRCFRQGGRERQLAAGLQVQTTLGYLPEAGGCAEPPCSPHAAMLRAVEALAAPRPVRVASATVDGLQLNYTPGVLRAMRRRFYYGPHWDSVHANAWAALRRVLCNETAEPDGIVDFTTVRTFEPLAAHTFSASAILTLAAPDREANPVDLRVWRRRWPALLTRCDLSTKNVYGVGVRLEERGIPADLDDATAGTYVPLRGDAGDLHLFNSEFVHDTPPIVGASSKRVVVGATVGFSDAGGAVEVWS